MKYKVMVGERTFSELEDKAKAIDLAKTASGFYLERVCRVANSKLETIKNTPQFVNGEEI